MMCRNVDFRTKPFKVLTGSEEYEAKAVIVCTGATQEKFTEGEQTFMEKELHIVQYVMAHFSEIKTLQLLRRRYMYGRSNITKFVTKVHIIHRRDTFRASKSCRSCIKQRKYRSSLEQRH